MRKLYRRHSSHFDPREPEQYNEVSGWEDVKKLVRSWGSGPIQARWYAKDNRPHMKGEWENTYLVTVGGQAVGYCNFDPKENP